MTSSFLLTEVDKRHKILEMSEIIAKNETEIKTQPWNSDLWVVAIILSFPIRLILEFWLPSPFPSAITYLVLFNIFLLPQESWLNSKIKNKFARIILLNLLFGVFILGTFAFAKYFAQFIKIPPIVSFASIILTFFVLAGLVFYWITKSTKK